MKKIFSFSLALSTMLTFNLVSLTKNSTCLAVLQDLEKLDVKSMINQFLLLHEANINPENGGKELIRGLSELTNRVDTSNFDLFFEMTLKKFEYILAQLTCVGFLRTNIIELLNANGFIINIDGSTLIQFSNARTANEFMKKELNAGDTKSKAQSLDIVLNSFISKFLPKKEETLQKDTSSPKKKTHVSSSFDPKCFYVGSLYSDEEDIHNRVNPTETCKEELLDIVLNSFISKFLPKKEETLQKDTSSPKKKTHVSLSFGPKCFCVGSLYSDEEDIHNRVNQTKTCKEEMIQIFKPGEHSNESDSESFQMDSSYFDDEEDTQNISSESFQMNSSYFDEEDIHNRVNPTETCKEEMIRSKTCKEESKTCKEEMIQIFEPGKHSNEEVISIFYRNLEASYCKDKPGYKEVSSILNTFKIILNKTGGDLVKIIIAKIELISRILEILSLYGGNVEHRKDMTLYKMNFDSPRNSCPKKKFEFGKEIFSSNDKTKAVMEQLKNSCSDITANAIDLDSKLNFAIVDNMMELDNLKQDNSEES